MKKVCVFCFLACFVFALCACHQNYGILSYQEKEIDAVCTLNDNYKIKIEKKNNHTCVGFLEPKSLSSISFVVEENTVLAKSNELEIPMEKEKMRGVVAISKIFSLYEKELTLASGKSDYSYMEFSCELGLYKLTLGKNNLPLSVEIISNEYHFYISIDTISLK